MSGSGGSETEISMSGKKNYEMLKLISLISNNPVAGAIWYFKSLCGATGTFFVQLGFSWVT